MHPKNATVKIFTSTDKKNVNFPFYFYWNIKLRPFEILFSISGPKNEETFSKVYPNKAFNNYEDEISTTEEQIEHPPYQGISSRLNFTKGGGDGCVLKILMN